MLASIASGAAAQTLLWQKSYFATRTVNGVTERTYTSPTRMRVDSTGRVYIAGYYWGPYMGFGDNDEFLTLKIDPTNGNVLWSSAYTGPLSDGPHDLAIDAAGNAYVAGRFQTSFSPEVHSLKTLKYWGHNGALAWDRSLAQSGQCCMSVVILPGGLVGSTAVGNMAAYTLSGEPAWSLAEGRTGGNTTAVDPAGNLVALGNGPPPYGHSVINVGGNPATVRWRRIVAGQRVTFVATDAASDVLVASVDYRGTSATGEEIVGAIHITKLRAADGSIAWSTELAAPGVIGEVLLAVDGAGDAYAYASDRRDPDAADLDDDHAWDARLFKLSGATGALAWERRTTNDKTTGSQVAAVRVDEAGEVYTLAADNQVFPIVGGSLDNTLRVTRRAPQDGAARWEYVVPRPVPNAIMRPYGADLAVGRGVVYVINEFAETDTALDTAIALTRLEDNRTSAARQSFVAGYYDAILGRAADAGGQAFWESEASRVWALGADLDEAWFAMAAAFYASPEFSATPRSDAEFVGNLYATFFRREPDGGGLAFWTAQLGDGMPRDVLLANFMFSEEFRGFTHAAFGDTAARPEVDMAVDFYRGVLGRLPDDEGLRSWVTAFRAAQCAGPQAVYAAVEDISSAFTSSPEYLARARDTEQYVADLYNAFLRRGGEVDGVRFWIGAVDGGRLTREQLRREFIAQPEFATRVARVLSAPCMP